MKEVQLSLKEVIENIESKCGYKVKDTDIKFTEYGMISLIKTIFKTGCEDFECVNMIEGVCRFSNGVVDNSCIQCLSNTRCSMCKKQMYCKK